MHDRPTIQGILEQRLPFGLQFLSVSISLLIAAAFAIVCIAQVDEIVSVPGVVTWSSPKIVISSADLAVMEATHVDVAQTVRKGQTLANIRSLEAEVQHKALQVEAVQSLARIARLSYEQQGWDVPQDPSKPFLTAVETMGIPDMNLSGIWRDQRDLYDMRLASYREEKRSVESNLARLKERVRVNAAGVVAFERRLPIQHEIEALKRKLFESGSGSRLDYLRAQEERLSVESSIAVTRQDLTEVEAEFEREAGRLAMLDRNWSAQIARELDEVRRDFAVLLARFEVEAKRASLTKILAPEDAIILNRAERAVGSVVQKGEHLFTMIPTGGQPVVRLIIPPKDIARLKGQEKVHIKFDGLPFQRHGHLTGRIESITGDVVPITDSREDANVAYLASAVVDPTSTLRSVPDGFKLSPGMPLTAEIIVGKRRLVSYFTYPLMQAGSRALRESELGPT